MLQKVTFSNFKSTLHIVTECGIWESNYREALELTSDRIFGKVPLGPEQCDDEPSAAA